jgi:phosphate transport system protein
MMRASYTQQLARMHGELVKMGELCNEAIGSAIEGLLSENAELRLRAIELEKEIDLKEREIESLCVRLLLREQPVAGDLRQITTAQRVIMDMERIGDQAEDIAELAGFMVGSSVKSDIHIADMAAAVVDMLKRSVEAFVARDMEKSRAVIAYDDVVDGLFDKVKAELIERITRDNKSASACLDLLMIAKYLERIGDHAENIAEWVEYSLTGNRGMH